MTSEQILLVLSVVFVVPFVGIAVHALWVYWLSPAARAAAKAYDLGFQAALLGADSESCPFGSSRLRQGWQDGLHDGRLYLSDKTDRQLFERDMERF